MLKILHVEDSALLSEYIKQYCFNHLKVENVATLAAAKDKLNRNSFDVLLIDLKSSNSSGLDIVRSLSKYNLPIIVLTVNHENYDIEELVAAGADDYIHGAELKNVDLVERIKFIYSRNFVTNNRAMEIAMARLSKNGVTNKYSNLSFSGISAMKPYLSCSVFA